MNKNSLKYQRFFLRGDATKKESIQKLMDTFRKKLN